ncbi:MAG: TRAP transporter permease [Lautropia sp.]
MPQLLNAATSAFGLAFVLFHVYAALFGPPGDVYYLPVHLSMALALLFAMYPLATPATATGRRVVVATDAALVLASLYVGLYILANAETWELKAAGLSFADMVTGTLLVLLVFEAVRRTVGWSMVLVALFFVVHALFADYFPGVLYGPPVGFEQLLQTLILGDAGIFGIPVRVMAQFVVVFLIFAQLLQSVGAGAFFTKLAFAAFGHRVGGPAKAAVVSSAMFGTFSGSGVSNVLTTGAFTIPMMKRLGYRPTFAGGVEAAAAVGGTLMPPVMGAVAFIMAELMGVSYLDVAKAAVFPALLYFSAIYFTVHFEACRYRLQRLARGLLPSPWKIFRENWIMLLPVIVLIVLLILDYSIGYVALVGCVACIAVSFISRRGEAALTPIAITRCCQAAVKSVVALSAACACAGIIIGAIFATGLSFQVSQTMVALTGDQSWILLVVGAFIAILLGLGLTASAVYITMAATVIPILKAGGIPEMSAHMFAFYYGVIGDITPPTALAAVAAAGIAGASPVSTMLQASRVGIAAFVVPLLFVYSPSLLLIGPWYETAVSLGFALASLFALSAALAAYLFGPVSAWQRLALAAAAALLAWPSPTLRMIGAVLLGLFVSASWRGRDAARGSAGLPAGVQVAGAATSDGSDLAAQIDRVESAPVDPAEAGLVWRSWIVLGATLLLLYAMGWYALHARYPEWWLVGLLALGALLVGPLRIGRTLAPRAMTVELQ